MADHREEIEQEVLNGEHDEEWWLPADTQPPDIEIEWPYVGEEADGNER